MTRYKTPSVRHNPPQRRQSKIYFLAKHLKTFALNDVEEDGASFSDTIPMWLVLWICWLPFKDGNDVWALLDVWVIDPANEKERYINYRKVVS